MTTKRIPFLTIFHVLMHLRLPVVFLVAWYVLMYVPLGIERAEGYAFLVMIFGIIMSINPFIMFVHSAKNLSYLKYNGYYDRMCMESPGRGKDFAISPNFVFCYKRRLCLPIRDIQSFKIMAKRYRNNPSKDSTQLNIWLNNEDSYCFMHYSGLSTDYGQRVIVECMNEVLRRNPRIVQIK